MTRSRMLWFGLPAVVLLVIVVIYRSLLPESKRVKGSTRAGVPDKQSLQEAWAPLRKKTDVRTVRQVLSDINRAMEEKPPQLSATQADFLRKEMGLTPDLLDEVARTRFEGLDARHLELCFLLRDAAQSLGLAAARSTDTGKQGLTTIQQAEMIFSWVTRQIALPPASPEPKFQPPRGAAESSQIALSFGIQSARSRAIVFLKMLQQLNIPAGLLGHEENGKLHYWACGVLGSDGQVYLFDPRLGIPLPGPNGKGIATLQQIRTDEKLIQQYSVGESKYDVTQEQAKKSIMHLVVSYLAMAPRMKFLEEKLKADSIDAHLYVDVQELKKRCEKAVKVEPATWALDLQRRFYPESEGGLGSPLNARNAHRSLVPFQALIRTLPRRVWVDVQTGTEILTGPAGNLLSRFFEPFVKFSLESGYPRDMVLRGQQSQARQKLSLEMDQLEVLANQYEREDKEQLAKQTLRWHDESIALLVQADQATTERQRQLIAQQNERLWNRYGRKVDLHVRGTASGLLRVRVHYQIALVLQEQAERALARIHYFGGNPARLDQAFELWERVRDAWKKFEDQFTGDLFSPMALQQKARSYEALAEIAELQKKTQLASDARRHAKANWRRAAERLKGMPRLGCLIRSQ